MSLPSNGWGPRLQTAPTDGCADIFGFYYKMELTLKLTTEQIIDFIQQIPPEEKISVLTTLAEQAHAEHNEQIKYGEAKVRKICAARL